MLDRSSVVKTPVYPYVLENGRIFWWRDRSSVSRRGYDPRILVRNTAISNGLKECVDIDTSPPPPETPRDAYEGYWNKEFSYCGFPPPRRKFELLSENSNRVYVNRSRMRRTDNRRDVGGGYWMNFAALLSTCSRSGHWKLWLIAFERAARDCYSA